MTQYAIVTDLNRCVGCLACAVACKVANNVPIGSFWNKVLRIGPEPVNRGFRFSQCGYVFPADPMPALREPGLRGGVPHGRLAQA